MSDKRPVCVVWWEGDDDVYVTYDFDKAKKRCAYLTARHGSARVHFRMKTPE